LAKKHATEHASPTHVIINNPFEEETTQSHSYQTGAAQGDVALVHPVVNPLELVHCAFMASNAA
jgi:hypothetical protein